MAGESSELSGDETRRHKQLLGLLRELVSEHGMYGAARELDMGYRTLSRSLAGGGLSKGLRMALERYLILREGAEVPESPWGKRLDELEKGRSEQDERLGALERGRSELTEQLKSQAGGLQSAREAISELAQKVAGGLGEMRKALASSEAAQRELRQRLEAVEKRSQARAETPSVKAPVSTSTGPAVGVASSRDGAVHDDDAEAVLGEWRSARDAEKQARTRLEQVTIAEKRLMLEIKLIRKHHVPIPPAERWGEADRSREATWRWDALRNRRRDRRRLTVRRWVRRVLTLGLWRR